MKLRTLFFANLLFFILRTYVFAWGPLTHYYINKETGNFSDFFNTAGMYTDSFTKYLKIGWHDVAHSPDPVKLNGAYPFVESPNFAYVLSLLAENPEEMETALGWGCHIAADWVAHKYLDLVYPTREDLKHPIQNWERVKGFLNHNTTEALTDLYFFYNRLPVSPKHRIYKKHIWKSFVNWKLVEEHEKTIKKNKENRELDVKNGLGKSTYTLCAMAIANPALTCPEEDKLDIQAALDSVNNPISGISVDDIQSRLKAFGILVTVEKGAFFALALEAIPVLPALNAALAIESRFSESKSVVNQFWLRDKLPRGIPEGYDPRKTSHPLAKPAMLASEQSSNPKEETISPDELFYKFWNDVADKALQNGAVETIETKGVDAGGEEFVDVETKIKDKALLQQALQQVINNYIANPETYLHLRLGKWAQRVFIEKQLDPDLILDFDLPVVSILSPTDLDIVNANPLVISGSATDKNFLSFTLDFGAGDNPATFTKICGGTQAVQESTLCSWDTTNLSGTYTLRLSAIDKNDNENVTTTKIFIGNPVFLASFGTKGKAPGAFKEPSGIALDAQENIYIADTENDRIQKLDKNFLSLLQLGGKRENPKDEEKDDENDHDKRLLKEPQGVFVDTQGNIFVADTEHHTVKKFDASGALLLTLGKKSTGKHDEDEEGKNPGEFNQPTGISVSQDGKIYVSDSENDRVQVFDNTGHFLFMFGRQGKQNGEFNQPMGLSLGADGSVFIADTENNRVQAFTKDGQFLFSVGHASVEPESEKDDDTKEFLKHPEAVFADNATKSLYISDTGHHRILKIDRFGNRLLTFGIKGKDISQFHEPKGLAVTPDGATLYVVDSHNDRLQKFQIKLHTPAAPVVAKTSDDDKKETPPVADDGTLVKAIMNAPNPVRGDVIRFLYKLTGKGKQKAKEGMLSVHVEVYSLTGKRIASFDCTAIDESCNWQQGLPNGVYVYRLTLSEAGGQTESKVGKIVVVR